MKLFRFGFFKIKLFHCGMLCLCVFMAQTGGSDGGNVAGFVSVLRVKSERSLNMESKTIGNLSASQFNWLEDSHGTFF